MKKVGWIIVIAGLLSCQAAVGKTLTYDAVLERAQEKAFDLKITAIEQNIAKAAVKEAKSAYYPTVSLVYNYEYQKGFNQSPGAFNSIGSTFINTNTRFQNLLSTRAEYTLFDFGIRRRTLDIAHTTVAQKDVRYAQINRDLGLTVTELYTKALLAYTELTHHKTLLPLYEEMFEIKERLYTAGLRPKLDIMEEAVHIAQHQTQMAEAEQALEQSLEELSAITIEPYSPEETVIEAFLLPQEPVEMIDGDIPLFKHHVTRHYTEIPSLVPEKTPEYTLYALEIEKKEKELSILKRQRLPQVSLYSSYLFYGSDLNNPLEPYPNMASRNVAVGVSATIPVFDGFKNNAKQEQLRLEIEKLTVEQEKFAHEIHARFERITKAFQQAQLILSQKKDLYDAQDNKYTALHRLNDAKVIDRATLLSQKIALLTDRHQLETAKIEVLRYLKMVEHLAEGTTPCKQD